MTWCPGEPDEPALRKKLTTQFLCPDGPGSSSPLNEELRAGMTHDDGTIGAEAPEEEEDEEDKEGLSVTELDALFQVACSLLEEQCLPSFGSSAEHVELAKKETEQTRWTEATLLQASPACSSQPPLTTNPLADPLVTEDRTTHPAWLTTACDWGVAGASFGRVHVPLPPPQGNSSLELPYTAIQANNPRFCSSIQAPHLLPCLLFSLDVRRYKRAEDPIRRDRQGTALLAYLDADAPNSLVPLRELFLTPVAIPEPPTAPSQEEEATADVEPSETGVPEIRKRDTGGDGSGMEAAVSHPARDADVEAAEAMEERLMRLHSEVGTRGGSCTGDWRACADT